MENVVELFKGDDGSGYVFGDENTFIIGMYVNSIGIMTEGDKVFVGPKAIDGVDGMTLTSTKDMDMLCTMWLAISQPQILKPDDE